MRRFLFAFFLVAALSALFSFSAFADECVSGYQSSGVAVYQKSVTASVSASAGDQFYMDVSVVHQSDIIKDPSGRNITAQIYNRDINWTWAITPTGSNYGAARVQVEGNSRIWVFFDRPVSGNITINFYITYTNSWSGGTFNGTPSQDLTKCSYVSTWNVSYGSLVKNGSGWATDQSNSEKLNQILAALDDSASRPDFLGSDALIYFDNKYFDYLYYSTGSVNFDSDGYIQQTANGDLTIGNTNPEQGSLFLPSGSYFFVMSAQQPVSSINLQGKPGSWSFDILSQTKDYANYSTIILVTVTEPTFFNLIGFSFPAPATGRFWGGVVPAPDDYLAGAAINPDQDKIVSDVDDAAGQQSQQEDQMWQNINTYKGDISFNLDGWDDAAGGLSYVTGVFMTVWNNSPTQPIVLSLMLGIAMLSIGRGVMAAVRVQRSRRDN